MLAKLRSGAALNAKEKSTHERGLVAVLKNLHDELDAYGWHDAPSDEQLLERLVALNAERSAEEAAGSVCWLRPEFQNPGAARPTTASGRTEKLALETTPPAPAAVDGKLPWPGDLPGQVAAVAALLDGTPQSLDTIAARFSGRGKKARLPQILDTLAALGRARRMDDGRWMG